MGGLVFKNTADLSAEELSSVKSCIPKLMEDLSIVKYGYVGSSAFDGPCGDIDIAVQPSVWNIEREKTRIFLTAMTLFGEENVKKVGQLISIKYGVPGREKGCQVDIIPCTNLKNTKWLMRGLFRHMLFALLAKDLSERISEGFYVTKVTISIPDGLQIIETNTLSGVVTTIMARTSYPRDVLDGLELETVSPNEVLDLKGLAYIVSGEKRHVLEMYPEYIKNLSHKKGYAEALQIVKEALTLFHM